MNKALLIGAGVLTLLALGSAKSRAASSDVLHPLSKRSAVVEGRSYTVTRFKGGLYLIVRDSSPETFLFIGQDPEKPISQGGDVDDLALLRDDMHRFPADLFQGAPQ